MNELYLKIKSDPLSVVLLFLFLLTVVFGIIELIYEHLKKRK